MNQLHLFPTITDWVELQADSPKKAFYRIMIEECQGSYSVIKESGCLGKVMDRRRWDQPNLDKALRKFNRILKEKLNPARGSPRKYERVRSMTDRTPTWRNLTTAMEDQHQPPKKNLIQKVI